jgi:hypothetical protein
MGFRAGIVGVIALLALAVPGASAVATAATKPPGLLRPKDLPGNLQQPQPAATFQSLSTPTVDAAACTETPASIGQANGAVSVQFSRVGDAAATIVLYENVAWFPSARVAKTVFARVAANNAAAVKCAALGFVPPKQTAPVDTVNVARVKFPKVGTASYAQTTGEATSTNHPTLVGFVSGPYIVLMGTTGPGQALSLKDLETSAARAQKRLPFSTPIPATTTTTAPKPLVVDPVASRCAEEGHVVSPSSSAVATLTFVNQTGQLLKIYWLDYTGARKPYGEVAAGARVAQVTYVGHDWLLADASGRCVKLVTTDAATTVTVSN